MKTLKTKLGIEVDLYLDNIDNVNIKITASCEEGTKDFFIDHGLCSKDLEDVANEPDLIGYLMDEINLDISHILKWTDMVTVGFLIAEVAKCCFISQDRLGIDFYDKNIVIILNEGSDCREINGIEEIKNFLEEHKNGI